MYLKRKAVLDKTLLIIWSILMIMRPISTPLDITLCCDPCAATMEAVCGNIITHGPLSQRFASGI